jgi:hypothetical protein
LPAYISFERYERNQAQLKANKAACGGTPQAGSALLSGLLICGRCGLRMLAQYNHNGHAARYVCSQMQSCYGEAFCQSLKAAPLDALISGLVLEALKPAAIEASLALVENLEAERAALERHWRQRLEPRRLRGRTRARAICRRGAREPAGGAHTGTRLGGGARGTGPSRGGP